jgi:hypothetical protein
MYLNKIWIFFTDFNKFPISNCTKICLVETKLIHVERHRHRQTDMMKLQCSFCDWKMHVKIASSVMEMQQYILFTIAFEVQNILYCLYLLSFPHSTIPITRRGQSHGDFMLLSKT